MCRVAPAPHPPTAAVLCCLVYPPPAQLASASMPTKQHHSYGAQWLPSRSPFADPSILPLPLPSPSLTHWWMSEAAGRPPCRPPLLGGFPGGKLPGSWPRSQTGSALPPTGSPGRSVPPAVRITADEYRWYGCQQAAPGGTAGQGRTAVGETAAVSWRSCFFSPTSKLKK